MLDLDFLVKPPGRGIASSQQLRGAAVQAIELGFFLISHLYQPKWAPDTLCRDGMTRSSSPVDSQ